MAAPQPVLDGERELLQQARAGDREAFGRVVEHYRERVFLAALSLVRNQDDARDMSQEAFVRVFRALERFDPERPFYPWIYRTLRNLCLDHIERHGSRRRVSLDAMMDEDHSQFAHTTRAGLTSDEDLRERMNREQMVRHLRVAIDELKPEFREIVVMKHLQEMPYKDIAEALDIPIGTVMSRLFHARKALAAILEKHRG